MYCCRSFLFLSTLKMLNWWWWGEYILSDTWNKAFSCVKHDNRPKINVKSWFAITVMIVKFSLFSREFVKKWHFQSWNHDVYTIIFVITFSVSIWKYVISNHEIGHFWRENVKCTIYFLWKREFGSPIVLPVNCFEDYWRCIHISYHILDFVQQKGTQFTMEQP